ncbi:polyprenol phosphomannose-dependent alpha 1,6 mannosyltransferase MptB [Glutamicibacter halophytocola]|uniref:polyprenol phosphomannose-dependent alpha 1,6 mannosyltransferase MptB n=1 Tax=Glutamicibacter halophytocola TaxID=1933880 RepID=UPI003219A6C3
MVWLTRTWIATRPRVQGATGVTHKELGRLLGMWAAPLMFSFPILSRDVYSYLAQGRMLHAGKSPYAEGISALPGWFDGGSDGLWAQSPSPYGPFFLVLARIIFFASNGIPEIGVGLLRVVAMLGVIGRFHFTAKLANKMGQNPTWANWAIVGNPLFLLTMIGGVHNDALMIAGVFCAMAYAYDRRPVASTLALSIAISVKPIVLLVLPFLGLIILGKNPSKRARWSMWAKVLVLTLIWLSIVGALTNLWFGWPPAMFSAGSACVSICSGGVDRVECEQPGGNSRRRHRIRQWLGGGGVPDAGADHCCAAGVVQRHLESGAIGRLVAVGRGSSRADNSAVVHLVAYGIIRDFPSGVLVFGKIDDLRLQPHSGGGICRPALHRAMALGVDDALLRRNIGGAAVCRPVPL